MELETKRPQFHKETPHDTIFHHGSRLYLQHFCYKISMCVGNTIWQRNVLQCYAVSIFFPISIRWWASFCVCATPTSPEKNGHHFFEVIVLCFYSVEGIMPIMGNIQCMRVCQHKSTDETTVSRRHTIVKMQQRKRKPSKSHCKRLKVHIWSPQYNPMT